MKSIFRLCGLLVVILTFIPLNTSAQSAVAESEQKAVLTAMLHKFLGSSDQREAHVSFWADDLVYTSSAGLRFEIGRASCRERV